MADEMSSRVPRERAGGGVADAVLLQPGMSKTLHNGLRVLEVLTARPTGISVTDLSTSLGLHRTVTHRLLKTLEVHGLVVRDDFKRFLPGPRLVSLAESVERDLRTLARPVLEELSALTNATSYLVTAEGDDEAMALMVVEPRHARVHVAFQAGQRHPRDRGSAGIALLAGRPRLDGERPEVEQARQLGYAISRAEVIPATIGIASPVPSPRLRRPASLGISVFEGAPLDELGPQVTTAATALGRKLDAIL